MKIKGRREARRQHHQSHQAPAEYQGVLEDDDGYYWVLGTGRNCWVLTGRRLDDQG
jgi:hypothetical protein